ncbi:MAG: 2Fe-2S iron-sulfur cluster-binding protein, partial [Sedimentisphaerales bacterium]|nr:2Fe-2S iron-sulfur cluster-binding protein [Sedimentisphaerales bacterium]
MDHFRVTFKPDNKSIVIHAGATVLEAAAQADIILNASCGGKGTCKKCRVKLLSEDKDVLACQYRITGDIEIMVPQISRFYEQKILEHGTERDIELSPVISKQFIDNKTIVYRGHTPIASEAGNTTATMYGVAVDIGTTTVVAKLIDLTNGQLKTTAASGNPQIAYGDDVISRISHGQTDKGLTELHDVIIYCVNTLIKQLCVKSSVPPEHIYEVTIAANTTMSHIF